MIGCIKPPGIIETYVNKDRLAISGNPLPIEGVAVCPREGCSRFYEAVR